jgi:hypothetical protein
MIRVTCVYIQGVTEISTEDGRMSTVAQKNENNLHKHGSGNSSVMN